MNNRMNNIISSRTNSQLPENLVVGGGCNGKKKDKYKINSEKKTNFIYILYNKKKVFLYKNIEDKIIITLDNRIIFVTKKYLSHDKKTNKIYLNFT